MSNEVSKFLQLALLLGAGLLGALLAQAAGLPIPFLLGSLTVTAVYFAHTLCALRQTSLVSSDPSQNIHRGDWHQDRLDIQPRVFVRGGVTEMNLIALSLGVAPMMVTAHHLFRIIFTVTVAGVLTSRAERLGKDNSRT